MKITQARRPGSKLQEMEHLTESLGGTFKASQLKVSQFADRLLLEIEQRGDKWTISLTPAEKETLFEFLAAQHLQLAGKSKNEARSRGIRE